MKNLLLIMVMLLMLNQTAFAQSKTSSSLSRIENSLYGVEYSDQTDDKRLKRIEESVYGEPKSGNIKTRLQNLSKDIASNQMGQEITPKHDTFEDTDSQRTASNSDLPKSDPSIDYPIVDSLEENTFGKTYKNLELNDRLANLEKKLFQKTYNDAFSERVDRLKNRIAYENVGKGTDFQGDYSNYYSPNTVPSEDNYFSPNTVAQNSLNQPNNANLSSKEINSKLNKIEKNVLKQSYSQDSTENRLSRLESAMFNTNFSSDTDMERFNRISSAANAQKTAKKYDSNRFQQKVETALQIGMFVLMVVAMIL